MKKYYCVLFYVFITACSSPVEYYLQSGNWLLTLDLGNDNKLPVNLTVDKDGVITMINATEKIVVNDIKIKGDSITIQPPVFEGFFKGVFKSKDRIEGVFSKPSLDRNVPFTLIAGIKERFLTVPATASVTGTWQTVFSPLSATDAYIARGSFTQVGSIVTGTFQTTTGDYRYLDGVVRGDSLLLSTFDGAHAFLFKAQIKADSLEGVFYSGNHWQESFTALRNPAYELPDATTLTALKDGYDSLDFSFPDTNGTMISPQDSRYKGKVVIVQLMGTWCPNCMDETRFLVKSFPYFKDKNVDLMAVAFEIAPTQARAFKAIDRYKSQMNVPYPVLLAQHDGVDKMDAGSKIPALAKVLSYPTTIIIDKKGKVRRVYSGFDGPATGAAYDRFTSGFLSFVSQLSQE